MFVRRHQHFVPSSKVETTHKLKVKRPGSEETREVNVDLLETFNWLIGLHAVAGLYHHYVMRDNTLTRMLPGRN